jgi:hypothetical protein
VEIHGEAVPFRHWLIDGLVPERWAEFAEGATPPRDWPYWVRYDNDCERRKRTCNDPGLLGEAWCNLLGLLGGWAVLRDVRALSGVAGLSCDPTLHGAGAHVTDPGGWLQPHLDYALHPVLDMERRLNLVLFLNREWREGWGGAFELYDDEGREAVRRVYPAFNRAVLWEPSDVAYHGTQRVADDAPPRVTAAAYYLAAPRPGVTRKRALFCPRRTP